MKSKASQKSLSSFNHAVWLIAWLFALLAVAFTFYAWSEKQVHQAHERRYQSFLLADELRQSSDDLTRMVRTYVITLDPRYKKYFQDILDIRDGKKPRPDAYQGIYWDLMLQNSEPPQSNSQHNIALLDLMRQAGFTDKELQKLAQAKSNSDALARIESEAMKLAESNDAKDQAKARMMVHDERYHRLKADIMQPIDEFLHAMDTRTHQAVINAENKALNLRNVSILFGIGLMLILWRAHQTLFETMGGSVDQVRREIEKIGLGDFLSPIPITKDLDNSIMGWLSTTQMHLLNFDREQKATKAKLQRQMQLYKALSHCNQAVVRSRTEDELFTEICHDVVTFGNMKMAWIGIIDPMNQKIIPCASFGFGVEYIQDIEISIDANSPLGKGPTGTAIRENKPYWCQDFTNDPITAPWHEKAKSFGWMASAALPLLKNDIVIGSLNLYADRIDAFDEDAQNLLLEMTSDVSFALTIFSREALRLKAENDLKESLAKTQLLLDSSLDAVISMDQEGHIVGWNLQAEKLFGYAKEQAMGQRVSDLIIPPEYRAAHYQGLARFLESKTPTVIGKHIEINGMKANGSQFPVELTIATLKQKQGYFFSAYIRDISQRKQAETELRIAATAFESQDGMIITDYNLNILKVNQAFIKITGYSEKELIGKTPAILKSGMHDAEFYTTMWKSIEQNKYWQGEIWNRRKNDEIYPQWLNISAVYDTNGKITNYVGTCSDISKNKEAEETIHNLAFYNPLTHLANRRLLLDRLHHALLSGTRHLEYGAVLFIDLDKFKELNDTSGHNVGDLLLIEVAERLQNSVQKGDTVAHLGGDDFVIMLENLNEDYHQAATQAEYLAEKILETFKLPFKLQGRDYYNTASIGISLFKDHEISVDDLLKHTETAMYQAKRSGRSAIRFFDANTHAAMESRIALEADLQKALPENQFKLHYQIQVDQNGSIQGAEALIRWDHPLRGLVSPIHFISLIEESGLILPIGRWIMETACNQLKAWKTKPATQNLQLAVNVSALQFRQPNFTQEVLDIIQKTSIDPSNLKLELTESMVLDDVEDTIFKMKTLKEIGVHFSLDDFGTGYSSLAYLTQLPFDQLKIDQSFVHNIDVNFTDGVIIQTIIGMAKNLGMEVIAEGVETKEQRLFLEHQGCLLYQGYLFGKPVPIEDLL